MPKIARYPQTLRRVREGFPCRFHVFAVSLYTCNCNWLEKYPSHHVERVNEGKKRMYVTGILRGSNVQIMRIAPVSSQCLLALPIVIVPVITIKREM